MKFYISKIVLNENGILSIYPQAHVFDKVYRSAMGVHWNQNENCLYHNSSTEWDVLRWYRQIVSAVKSEYGVQLEIYSETIYESLDDDITSVIKITP